MRYALLTLSLFAALAVTGCGKAKRAAPPSTPVALADFCTEFVDAICPNVGRCACSPTAEADCRADLATTCPSDIAGPDVQARVAAGTVTYDANAAGAMIATLAAQTSCDNPMTIFGWGITDVFTFGGTLNGTKAPGAPCSAGTGGGPFGGECAQGVCTAPSSTAPTTCWGMIGLGAPCGAGISGICVDLDASFTSLEDANILLRCNIPAGAGTGTCAARLANGAACSSPDECASLYCDGTTSLCAPGLANGVECMNSTDCASGYCNYSASPSVCAASGVVANGGACTDGAECVSTVCQGGRCVPGICSTYSPPPPPPV
jgi:hypothetical protein